MNRIEMIKAAAEKSERRRNLMARIGPSRVGELTSSMSAIIEARKVDDARFEASMESMDTNPNHHTDSAQYANEHYGEVKASTTNLDNDWN